MRQSAVERFQITQNAAQSIMKVFESGQPRRYETAPPSAMPTVLRSAC